MPSPRNDVTRDVVALEQRLIGGKSQFALEDALVAGIPCRVFQHAPGSLPEIYRKALLCGQRTLAICDNEEWPVERMFHEAARFAHVLAERFQVGRGMRVAIALEDGPAWIAAFIAVTGLNATAVLVPRCDDLDFCCSATEATVAVVRRGSSPVVAGIGKHCLGEEFAITGDSASAFDWSTIVPAPDDEAVIAFTSGSTGEPKAAILSHRGIIIGLFNMMLAGTLAATTRRDPHPMRRPGSPSVVMLAPLSHVSGYAQFLLMLMLSGKLVFPRSGDAEDVIESVERVGATAIAGLNPALLQALLDHDTQRLTSLGSVNIGGMVLHTNVIEQIAARLPAVWLGSGYGLTETSGSICAIGGEEFRLRPTSSGRVLPSVGVAIRDECGCACNAGETGEIWLHGAMLMRGYCAGPALQDGWFRTGDLGFLSDDRHLHVVDRFDGLSAVRGVSAMDLERLANKYPEIQDAAAFQMPGLLREIVIAVVPKLGMEVGNIQADMATRLPDVRMRIVPVSTIPRNRRGKISRAKLLRQIAGPCDA